LRFVFVVIGSICSGLTKMACRPRNGMSSSSSHNWISKRHSVMPMRNSFLYLQLISR